MDDRTFLGLIESVSIENNNLLARIDTGATSSSIDIKLAEELNLGPIINTKIVKSASGVRKRPIIKIKVKIKDSIIEAEFTLADRSHMTYQILIGQNVLKKGNFLIDPQQGVE